MATRTVSILEEDADLGQGLDRAEHDAARAVLRAHVIDVGKGAWNPHALGERATTLMILRGLLARRIRVASVSSVELLGPGDLLRPWERPLGLGVIPPADEFHVLLPLELALLDRTFHEQACRWPALELALSNRVLRRARNLSFLMAIGHFTRVEDRLLYAFWHLADNWGRVTADGVVVPFRLTHEMLADIVGAQRPSVSTAVKRLERAGRIARRPDRSYVLLGDPPEV